MRHRPLSVIAAEIREDWKKVAVSARPYLDAMFRLNQITDDYGHDRADEIVVRFLVNANSWRGETARRIKKELNAFPLL